MKWPQHKERQPTRTKTNGYWEPTKQPRNNLRRYKTQNPFPTFTTTKRESTKRRTHSYCTEHKPLLLLLRLSVPPILRKLLLLRPSVTLRHSWRRKEIEIQSKIPIFPKIETETFINIDKLSKILL